MCLMNEILSVRATDLLSAFFTLWLFISEIGEIGGVEGIGNLSEVK
jgi:hypothetical protein